MRTLVVLTLSAVALCACTPEINIGGDEAERPAVRTVARLTCPERSGDLMRLALTEDGRSCTYTAPNSGEVTLRLIPVGAEGAQPALAPIEAELREIVPAPVTRPVAAVTPTGGESVDISLPFFEVRTGEDSARVRMPGIEVDAAGEDATVNIGGGGSETVQVNARDGASEVRVSHGGRRDVRRTYILSRDEPTPAGWRSAGYQARGPLNGPLVVATARSRNDSDQLFDELEHLIDLSFEVPGEASAEAAERRAEEVAERIEQRTERAAEQAERQTERAAERAERAAERAARAAERALER